MCWWQEDHITPPLFITKALFFCNIFFATMWSQHEIQSISNYWASIFLTSKISDEVMQLLNRIMWLFRISCFACRRLCYVISKLWIYDKVASVPESWVQWRAVFQSGSRVLKRMIWTFFIYIYAIDYGIHSKHQTLKLWKSLNTLYRSN